MNPSIKVLPTAQGGAPRMIVPRRAMSLDALVILQDFGRAVVRACAKGTYRPRKRRPVARRNR